MSWRVAVDIGGTFTDVVALEEGSGTLHLAKVRSTSNDPSEGFITGVEHVMRQAKIAPAEIAGVFHGTTVATNAILERKYATMGLIITRGYREALECARQTVPGEFGDITWWVKPPRVVPLELVREVSARMEVSGQTLRAVDANEVIAIARELKEKKIVAVAVSLLHSYRNPSHEEEIRGIIRQIYPDCRISISSEILREYREYERTNTTCLNTALMPLLSAYHEKIEGNLRERGITAPFHIMRSSGGLAQAQEISRLPIAAALSGPAAGAIAATYFAKLAGCLNVITLDMGGTSADICLVENGAPRMLTEGRVDIYDIKTPMIDIHTVGAGGGSIAWMAGGRSLKVGPQSAGSTPGPACYQRGGTEPTVTDANLVLGRITPSLAGGTVQLSAEKAAESLKPIAFALGLDLTAAADGILRVAIENIASGIRTVSVKRGRDPRDYVLVAFGGAGPLHACYLADWLTMSRIIIPPNPGVASAYGLLLTDVRVDLVHTDVQREDQLDLKRAGEEIGELENRVRARLNQEGVAPQNVRLLHFADMRYAGQAYEIRVPFDEGPPQRPLAEMLRVGIAAFHLSHKDLYGYSYEGAELIELVNLGVTGLGLLKRPRLPERRQGDASPQAALKARTPVHFSQARDAVECPIYSWAALQAGNIIQGPAIIEQYDSTTVVEVGWQAEMDQWGNLALAKIG
jgi:N-methylhydantoinase A